MTFTLASRAVGADSSNEASVTERLEVTSTPLEGSGIDPQKVPAATYTIDPTALDHDVSSTIPDVLQQRVPGVQINDVTGNAFQPTVQYRGFAASPVLGTPQGIAVYQNGVRTNEAFGDTVNWDLIPEFAISGLQLVSNNPAFGLNALGGALALTMKNGFNFHESDAELYGGSFGRISATAETGFEQNNVALYLGADVQYDLGWRDRSASDLHRIYGDVGMKENWGEIHLSFTGASNDFGAVGPTPIELLNQRWESVFTTPQATRNELALVTGTLNSQLTKTLSLESALYYRGFRQSHVDGNTTDDVPDDFPKDLTPGEIDRTKTQANSFGGVVQIVGTGDLFGRANRLAAGGSFDRGLVDFSAIPELGTIKPDLFVAGNGTIIATDDVSASARAIDEHLRRLLFHRHLRS